MAKTVDGDVDGRAARAVALLAQRSPATTRARARTFRSPSLVDLCGLVVGAAIATRWVQVRRPVSVNGVVLVCVSCAAAAQVLHRQTCADLPQVIRFSGFIVAFVTATGILLGGGPGVADTAVRTWVSCAACLFAARMLSFIRRSRIGPLGRHGISTPPRGRATLVIAPPEPGRAIAERLRREARLHIEPIGLIDGAVTNPSRDDDVGDGSLPTLGGLEDVTDVVTVAGVEQVLVAFPSSDDEQLAQAIHRCWELRVPVLVLAPLFDLRSRATRVASVGGLPLFALSVPGADCWQRRTKYALDRIAALLGLLLLSPLLLGIAAAIRLTMGGPVLFLQERVGEHGRVFTLLKFRTMTGSPQAQGEADAGWASALIGAPVAAEVHEAATAPRCTRLGGWLRRTALDELPQLINVVRGEMSLVGPRPERAHYVAGFTRAIDRYADRHRVRCGLTGWSQVHGLRGETSLEDRVASDNYYIENWSPWLDIRILGRTLPALAKAPHPRPVDVPHRDEVATPNPVMRSHRFQRAARPAEHDRPVVVEDRCAP
jgi:exopolysaccharide biosynthesis polyprenyl glycosylphosphotransferase